MTKSRKILIIILCIAAFVLAAGCGKKPQLPAGGTAQESVFETPAVITTAPKPAETETAKPGEAESPKPDEAETAKPDETGTPAVSPEPEDGSITVEEDGEYSDKEHVALYIHLYGRLPSNYITKKDARAAGWIAGKGNLITVLPGKSIGGDRYTNYEGTLPDKSGRKYYECDINYNPKGKTSGRVTRGPERIVFSNDGLIFYTADHYATFEQLY